MSHLLRAGAAGALVAGLLAAGTAGTPGPARADVNLTQYVDPFIGTAPSNSPNPVPGGAGGSTYPGAVVPFGMVQLSPDTPNGSPSGYGYDDRSIDGISLTHFDGAGCPNNEDLPFLPVTGPLATSPGTHWADYASAFRHDGEEATPGFYRVTLDKYGVGVELTATPRTGFARFTFPASNEAQVLIHAGRSATGNRAGTLRIVGQTGLEGSATAGGFCGSSKTYQIYFAAE